MQISPFIATTSNSNVNDNNDNDDEDSTAVEKHSGREAPSSSAPLSTIASTRSSSASPVETMRPYWVGGIPAAPIALPHQHGNVWILGVRNGNDSSISSSGNNNTHVNNNNNNHDGSCNRSGDGGNVIGSGVLPQHPNRQQTPHNALDEQTVYPVTIRGGIRTSVSGMVQSAVAPAAVKRTRRQLAKPYDNGRKRASKACVECNKKHVRCGFDRPCKRCVRLGLNCVEVVSTKKRGRKKKSKKQQEQSSTPEDCTLTQPQTLVVFPQTTSDTASVLQRQGGPINPLLITDATGSSNRSPLDNSVSANINPLLKQ